MRMLLAVLLGIGLSHAIPAQQMSDPEALAGRWEASDGRGGHIGMTIGVTTYIAGDGMTLVQVQHVLQGFTVGLYRRQDGEVEPGHFNYFASSPNDGASWDGHRLIIDWRKTQPEVHVDLLLDQRMAAWTGKLELEKFRAQQVTLKRPAGEHPNPFVGTWLERNSVMNNCLHLVQDHQGALMGWADDLQIPGRLRYANGIQQPAQALEHYGELARVTRTSENSIAVELRAGTPICCSHSFTAELDETGSLMLGNWPAGPNQASRPARWKRVKGNSCAQELSMEAK